MQLAANLEDKWVEGRRQPVTVAYIRHFYDLVAKA